MLKKLFSLFSVLLLVILTISCGNNDIVKNDVENQNNVVSHNKVVITYTPTPLNIPSIIEKEHNIFVDDFKDIGYNFEYANLPTGTDRALALASSDVDIINGIGDTSLIIAAASGIDIKILSIYSRCPKAFALFSNDANINSPNALKGKKVGGAKGSNLHELLIAYLKSGGLSINDVEFIHMDMQSAIAALETGSIDVALIGGAPAYNLEQAGKHKICDGDGYISAYVLTASSDKYIKENPSAIFKFKSLQHQILEYIENDKENSYAITADVLGLTEEVVNEMQKMYDFSPNITDKDIENLKKTEAFLYENGLIENRVNIEELIN